MHQSCDTISSAWFPEACSSKKIGSIASRGVNGPYYALTFVASFLRGAKDFRVIPIQESDDSVIYAGYESGKLSKLAIVNLPPQNAAGKDTDLTTTVDIKMSPDVMHLKEVAHIDLSTIRSESMFCERRSRTSRSSDQIPLAEEPAAPWHYEKGTLSLKQGKTEAILFEVAH